MSRKRMGKAAAILGLLPCSTVGNTVPSELVNPDGYIIQRQGFTFIKNDESMDIGPSAMITMRTQGELGTKQAPIFGGAKVYLLNSQSVGQMMSVIIQTSQGKLIVVDGGLPEDVTHLTETIQALGGHVSAWLLTHHHGDHAGALYNILQDPSRTMVIDKIYCSLADNAWYEQKDPRQYEIAAALNGTFAVLPPEMVDTNVTKGQEILVDDVRIQVMNSRYDFDVNPGNNASIVYKVFINGKSILFLGDLGEEGGERLMTECTPEELKSDVVQMAHHGQYGVNERFYQTVNPSVCLWPTPQWLWDNDGGNGAGSGHWYTASTKQWISRLGVTVHYCMKDGDQVIE